MSVYTYKCPNCGSDLRYDAKTHILHCRYCDSDFTADELEERKKEKEAKLNGNDNTHEKTDFEEKAVLYTCPSCGAEIITDESTAATFCYYCHNAVILSGKLDGNMKPDYIIPFKIDKEEAEKRFLTWVRRKRFVPKDFVNEKSIEKMCGVYFPYWITDCSVNGMYTATGRNIRVWITGDLEYTETKIYDIRRGGSINFRNITNFALDDTRMKLATGVQPFKEEEMEEFKMPYLSGFMAEKRNIDRENMTDTVNRQINSYSERLLESSVSGYSSVSEKKISTDILNTEWKYALLPVWVLTYISGGKTYYYALNGQTGKAVGELPISKIKVALLALGVFAMFFLFVFLIGGILL